MIAIFKRRRPRVLVVNIVLALFVLLRNTEYAIAKKSRVSEKSYTNISNHGIPSISSMHGTGVPHIRGGSLEEGSSQNSEEDGNDVGNEDTKSDEASASITEVATALRLEGKKHHDEGNFVKAAEVFQKAADTFLDGDSDEGNTDMRMSEDYATCRLHQALCNLKSKNYEMCIEACTDVLQDNVDGFNSGSTHSPAINARAYHRRAKAKMALGDNSGALHDARTASFLGDGKAVNLYGKLMRETSSSDLSSGMNPLLSPETSSSSSFNSPVSPLLGSLLNQASVGDENGLSSGTFPDFSPASLLMGNSGGGNLLGALGSGGGGMAKSVIKNLVNKLDDESTQLTICNFLQKTSKPQLLNLASMAGIGNLEGSQVDRLVNFCHGVTPKCISRAVRGTKAVVYFVKVIRRTMKVINKYKSLIVLALILQWTKSAISRPLPIDKRAARKAAKLAAKEALKEATKASIAGFY